MKKIGFIFLVMLIIGFMGCQLDPVNNGNHSGSSSSEETNNEETETTEVYVAYNVNNVWHEELLTDSFDEETVWYWNYICDDLRYWDKECTDPILNNDRNAVNSQSGRLIWSTEENCFIPYVTPTI